MIPHSFNDRPVSTPWYIILTLLSHRLYGDDTVRPQEKVVDFSSGLKAAGKGFGYGFYDGISGLITQPIRGAEKEGTAGLIKGIGRGLAGVVLKPVAGMLSFTLHCTSFGLC